MASLSHARSNAVDALDFGAYVSATASQLVRRNNGEAVCAALRQLTGGRPDHRGIALLLPRVRSTLP
jgi:hypothetical protein